MLDDHEDDGRMRRQEWERRWCILQLGLFLENATKPQTLALNIEVLRFVQAVDPRRVNYLELPVKCIRCLDDASSFLTSLSDCKPLYFNMHPTHNLHCKLLFILRMILGRCILAVHQLLQDTL